MSSNMNRLTKSGAVSQKDINELLELSNENQFGINDAYYKLKHYEDLEEEGRLIVLSVEDICPCKNCDVGWHTLSCEGCDGCENYCERLKEYQEKYNK